MMKIMLLVAVLLAVFGYTADQLTAQKQASVPAEKKQYWLVLLKKGANKNQDSAAAAKIEAAHLRNISRMQREGVLLMAGPVGRNNDLEGVFIIDTKDSAAAAAMLLKDPAVQTGRLKAEIYRWNPLSP